MKYTVYVLKSQIEKKSYVGFTSDIRKRLEEHNSGKSYFTKRFLPWKVVYTEEIDNYQDARKRERYLKSASGRRIVLKKIFENIS